MSFQGFSPNALTFLTDLKANNTRDWFAENKKTYEFDVKLPANDFADEMAGQFLSMTGLEHTSKVFRVHRDVRFSKDKTPYNSHLHIGFTPICDAASPPMWFFGVDPDKLTVGCGNMGFDKASLERFRAYVDSSVGAELVDLINKLTKSGFRIGDPELKRVPSPYDKEHPRGDLLRRKGLAVWYDFNDPRAIEGKDIVAQCHKALKPTKALFDILLKI